MTKRSEKRLVEQFIAQTPIEAMKAFCCGMPGAM
jgi:hypothetical protein